MGWRCGPGSMRERCATRSAISSWLPTASASGEERRPVRRQVVADHVNVRVSTAYAPLAVVEGLSKSARSFVELDYNVRNCINLLVKGEGIGLAGGISLKRLPECDGYLDYVIERHRKYQPSLRVLGRYPGMKTEITFPDQDRNYLFHIVPRREGLWASIPGKFTLGFSLAPEFYRRIYRRNPRRVFIPTVETRRAAGLIAEVRWRSSAGEALQGSAAQESEDRGAVPTVASELAGSALFVVASAQKENGVPREGAQGYKTGLARRGDIDA